MQLSPHFTLEELTKSQTATRRGIRNVPNQLQIETLKWLCVTVLEPIRERFGKPVRISSGFRAPRLNLAIGGSSTSQHCKGEAADIEVDGAPNRDVAEFIRDTLVFDQVILEGAKANDPKAGWVHVSYRVRGPNRKQVLKARFINGKAKYTSGL
jgi:zinc D-Ala-D-Ala carboxypeptidase